MLQKKVCLASHNNHPTSLASSWDISFFKSLVQQDPKGSNKVAHLFILDVYVSPNRKYVNLSIIFYILDFSFFMSQDDAYFHIHQNDPGARQTLASSTPTSWVSSTPLRSTWRATGSTTSTSCSPTILSSRRRSTVSWKGREPGRRNRQLLPNVKQSSTRSARQRPSRSRRAAQMSIQEGCKPRRLRLWEKT